MIWFLIGYMWLFLHRPFEVWPWMGTLRVERVYMIIVLIAWLSTAEKELTENKINFAVALFAIAMVIATVMSPYVTDILNFMPLQDWLKYLVFYMLVMTSVKTEKDLKIIFSAFLLCFFLYMSHSYWEYLNGKYSWAMGTKRMIGVDSTLSNPNAFGASVVIMLPVLLPMLQLFKKKWMYLFGIMYFLLSARCVQLTGSRTAFVILGASLVIAAALSKKRFVLLPLMFVGGILLWFTLTDNLRDRYMTLVDPTLNESATQSAEGRWDGLIDGIANWQASPIWGVGPNCHGYTVESGLLTHCLYGQIPSELGTIGVVAFLMLLVCFFLNHYEITQACRYLTKNGRGREGAYCYSVSFAIICGIFLLLMFGVGGHNGYRYTWIWFAAFQAVAGSIIQNKVHLLRKEIFYGTSVYENGSTIPMRSMPVSANPNRSAS